MKTAAQIEDSSIKFGESKSAANHRKVTVQAAGKSNPRINFEDGRELVAPVNYSQTSQSQPNNLIAADFDSDGVPDLVTADESGILRFYQGSTDSIYPHTADAQARQLNGTFSGEPFSLTGKNINLSFAPDYLETGDFNADGFQDILAAANGGDFLLLLAGDGHGNFSPEKQIAVDGRITALKTGEIGRADGQTDVAVALTNKTGNYLVVFEHPQGAFAHEPEISKISAPVNALAIGNLDDDFYGDIAAGGSNILTVVQGRGQAFPWDLSKDLDIKRPAANVLRRVLPFSISDLTIGKFTGNRDGSLALLSDNGSIYTLESVAAAAKTSNFNAKPKTEKSGMFMPTGSRRSFAKLSSSNLTDEETQENFGLSKIDTTLAPEEQEKQIRQNAGQSLSRFGKLSKEDAAKLSGAQRQKAAASKELSKKRFLESLAAKPTNFAVWNLQNFVSDGKIASAAHSPARGKLKTARVSGSNKDDLILLDTDGKQIQLIVQPAQSETKINGKTNYKFETQKPEIVSFAAEGNPLAVLPMRLNADALDDLVVLQTGEANPSIVQTSAAQVLTVTTTEDGGASNCSNGGTCSLRDAITTADNLPNTTIVFNIPGGGAQTISLLSELPPVNKTVTIDGTTQPGYAGTPLIEIDGDNLSGGADGIKIMASSCVVRGLAINRFPHYYDSDIGSYFGGNGISLETPAGFSNNHGNIIEGNFLGVAPDGVTDKGDASAGLIIFSADGNTIGGTNAFARNVISGNGESLQNQGVGIESIGDNNVFENNFIGTNAAGTAALPNSSGVLLSGANNQFGADGAGNVVSGNGNPDPNVQGRCLGNGLDEVTIFSENDPNTNLTLNNTFKADKIGTNAAGTGALGNCGAGITTSPLSQLVIGSVTQNGRNIISGNGNTAIDIEAIFYDGDGGLTNISGDNIGTDITGTTAIPNDTRNGCIGLCNYYGVITLRLDPAAYVNVGAPNDSPNSSCTGFCTLVSGNKSGVFIQGAVLHSGATGTVGVFNNFVGTDVGGTNALPNTNGIYSFSGTTYAGLAGSGANVISGNSGAAIFFQAGYGFDEFVQNNLIGTDVSGHNAVPNNSDLSNLHPSAVYVDSDLSADVYVGGTNAAQRNVISGNRGGGMLIYGQSVILNNYIGVDVGGAALPNTEDGINAIVEEAGKTFIGSTDANLANVISYNGGVGIDVFSFSSRYPGAVEIRGNNISDNGGIGIDLNGDGVTANDCDDSDTGPNGLQNYPELNAPTFQNGSVTVHGTLISSIREDYTIDFYASDQVDSSNYGEGQTYIGSLNVQTNLNGFAAFDFTPAVAVGSNQIITATATDNDGETSEFSCGAGLCGQNLTNEVRAASGVSCAAPIIVNTNTDDADADLTDGVCDTDLNTSGLQCSLRAAIDEANRRTNAFIAFAVPGGGVQTITPASSLPSVTVKMTIDATTQSGYNGSPLIEITGTNAGTSAYGMNIAADKTIVRGLAINSFSRDGIVIHDASHVTIESCYIGTDATGNILRGNQLNGIGILRSQSNIIGGTNSIAQNVINGNANAGIYIYADSPGNTITGNRIGITVDDSTAANTGRQIFGVYIQSNNNTIGGSTLLAGTAPGNVISGNMKTGITFDGSENAVSGNTAAGNIIGGTADGLQSYGNGAGIGIAKNVTQTTVGGSSPRSRNIISGNKNEGVIFFGANTVQPTNNFVQGNYIGTNINGSNHLGDSDDQIQVTGISITDASNNIIGGDHNARNIISGNRGAGVSIQNSSLDNPDNPLTHDNTVIGNYIGIGQDGLTPVPNIYAGIVLSQNTTNNFIGAAGLGNVISGNYKEGSPDGYGIVLAHQAFKNFIFGNFIGTDSSGTKAVPNNYGIYLRGTTLNFIGGVSDDLRNTISGNKASGIALIGIDFVTPTGSLTVRRGIDSISENSSNPREISSVVSSNEKGQTGTPSDNPQLVGVNTALNQIDGNFIGTDVTGNVAIPNAADGIEISYGANQNVIGNTKGNLISGNKFGIFIFAPPNVNDPGAVPTGNYIFRSAIGTNSSISAAIPNTDDGIVLSGAKQTDIASNTISGNGGYGVELDSDKNLANTIENNRIGTGIGGATVLPNQSGGIDVTAGSQQTVIQGNTISGNGGNGITIGGIAQNPLQKDSAGLDTAPAATIIDNLIGVALDDNGQTFSVGNALSGIELDCARQIFIGQPNQPQNIISANHDAGIRIMGSNAAQSPCGSQQNTIQNSIIGTDAGGAAHLGNGMDGILIENQSSQNIIGGTANGAGNIIADNGGSGVRLDPTAGAGNLIDPNSIFANGGLGIDLGNLGITLNDPHDADSGANNLQNFPEISSAVINGGSLSIKYKLDSAPANSNYGASGVYVEFFKADATLSGQTFLGSDYYQTSDYNAGAPGLRTITFGGANTPGISAGDKIVATATDADGNTSEFTGANVGIVTLMPTAAAVSISGKVLAGGRGLANARVELTKTDGTKRSMLTNSFGNFTLSEVQAGAAYVIGVSAKRYTFAPQIVSVTDNISGLIFNEQP